MYNHITKCLICLWYFHIFTIEGFMIRHVLYLPVRHKYEGRNESTAHTANTAITTVTKIGSKTLWWWINRDNDGINDNYDINDKMNNYDDDNDNDHVVIMILPTIIIIVILLLLLLLLLILLLLLLLLLLLIIIIEY